MTEMMAEELSLLMVEPREGEMLFVHGVPSDKVQVVIDFHKVNGYQPLMSSIPVQFYGWLGDCDRVTLRNDLTQQIQAFRNTLDLWENGSDQEIAYKTFGGLRTSFGRNPLMEVVKQRKEKVERVKAALGRLEPFYREVFGHPCP